MPAFVRFHRLFIEIERAHAGASMKYNKVQKSEKLPSWRIASKIQRGGHDGRRVRLVLRLQAAAYELL